jgi:hypothetical protein
MSLLDQNWGVNGNADEETHDDNQTGRQVNCEHIRNSFSIAIDVLFPRC